MNRALRSAAAVLLAVALPAQAWAVVAMGPCVSPNAAGRAAVSGPPVAAPVAPRAGQAAGHCAHDASPSAQEGRGTFEAGADCGACHLLCGVCHPAFGAMFAPPMADVHDLLRPVLNAGVTRPDLSIPAAHAPPPPRS